MQQDLIDQKTSQEYRRAPAWPHQMLKYFSQASSCLVIRKNSNKIRNKLAQIQSMGGVSHAKIQKCPNGWRVACQN